jgi:CubicO group peptidase (beta-lactamase class C family)
MGVAWVAAHGIAAADYQARFDTLVPRGFRLRWVQAYADGAAARFNGIWDAAPGPRWEARHGIADRDFQAHFDGMVRQGLRLRCISAYAEAGGIRYATLWDAAPSPAWEAHHGIAVASYQAHFDGMVRRGFRLVHLNACGIGNDAIFATIWEQAPGPAWEAHHGLDAAAWQASFDALTRRGFRLRLVTDYVQGGQPRYAGIWEAGAGAPWQARHGIDAATYQLDFDDFRLGGYRPTCVAGCGTGQGARFVALFENTEFDGATLSLIAGQARGFMDRFAVPGLSLAFSQGGRLVYAQAFGHADAARREILRTRHRMRSASVAKPITATTLHRLRQRGLLTVDDAVFGQGALLGTTYGGNPYGANLLAIRLHHLLEHTSGAWDNQGAGGGGDFDGMDDPMFAFAGQDHAGLIGQVLDNYPVDPPDTRWAYSNFAYCLLGRIIAARGGASYADVVQREVFGPTGAAGMSIAGNRLADRQAWEVEYVGQGGEDPYGMDVARMDAHGGWVGTASDHLRFAVHVDGAGGGLALLDATSLGMMLAPTALNANYAQGWGVNAAPNRWHLGSLPGTRSILVTTAGGMSWCALCNTRAPGGPQDDAMGTELDAMLWRIVNGVARWPGYDLFAG